jgi:hypothetical protein
MKLQDMNVLEVITIIIDNIKDADEYILDNVSELVEVLKYQSSVYVKSNYPNRIANDFIIDIVERKGGEDQGTEYYTVFRISKVNELNSVYIKISGYYSSYDDYEYQNFNESVKLVKSVEKTIIIYEEV